MTGLYSVANTFDGILYNICHAASLAVMPYVSQTIGAESDLPVSDMAHRPDSVHQLLAACVFPHNTQAGCKFTAAHR